MVELAPHQIMGNLLPGSFNTRKGYFLSPKSLSVMTGACFLLLDHQAPVFGEKGNG